MSAMVDRRLSTLNPNAPVFDPVGFREVEDFSPKWWDLVTTSKWFRDFWLSANSEYDFDDGDDFSVMEEEFEEMIASSDGGSTVDSVTGNEYNHIYTHLVKFMDLNFRSGEKSLMEMIASSDGGSTVNTVTESDVAKYLKMLLDMAESSKEKLYRSKVKMSSCAPKYNQKKMYMNPNFNCRRNHHIYQPR